MKKCISFFITASVLWLLLSCSVAQTSNNSLKLERTIDLPNVSGRIDHLAIDLKKQIVYIAALGNNTVEVVDLKLGKVIHTIKDLDEPQGIIYIPDNNSILVSNGGTGECIAFNADSFEKTGSVKLSGDADNIRYDATDKLIYVGYGNGGIAIIDARTFKNIKDIQFLGHPESFQVDKTAKKIYVNIPDERKIDVIDLENKPVTVQWDIPEAKANFPMALDEMNHRLFIGCRHPAKLLIVDTQTGKIISSFSINGDVDDIFYNPTTKEIYLSCGNGYIDTFKQTDKDSYTSNGTLSTHSGARTSLFIPELNKIIVASPAGFNGKASLLVYNTSLTN
jgi:DNA-binding beta-propeller fold protein YncE